MARHQAPEQAGRAGPWIRPNIWLDRRTGGRGGIRTHERLAPLAVFKTAALNRSATLPPRGMGDRLFECKGAASRLPARPRINHVANGGRSFAPLGRRWRHG